MQDSFQGSSKTGTRLANAYVPRRQKMTFAKTYQNNSDNYLLKVRNKRHVNMYLKVRIFGFENNSNDIEFWC